MHCLLIRGSDVQLEPSQGEPSSFLQSFRGMTAEETAAGDPLDPVLPRLAVISGKRVMPAGRIKEYEQSRREVRLTAY